MFSKTIPQSAKPYKWQAHRATRTGATSVEFALVAIPLFMLVMASIEFGRGMMAVQAMEEAARCGCRTATLKGQTAASAESEIQRFMSLSGINNYTSQVLPSAIQSVPQWSPITVRVSASFDDITWLPVPRFLSGRGYTASCVLPREAEPE